LGVQDPDHMVTWAYACMRACIGQRCQKVTTLDCNSIAPKLLILEKLTCCLCRLSLQTMSEMSYLTSFLWSDWEAHLIRLAYKGAIASSSCQEILCAQSSCTRVPCLQGATLLCLTVTVMLQMRAFIGLILQIMME